MYEGFRLLIWVFGIVGATICVVAITQAVNHGELSAEDKLRIECTQHAKTDAAFDRCMHHRRGE